MMVNKEYVLPPFLEDDNHSKYRSVISPGLGCPLLWLSDLVPEERSICGPIDPNTHKMTADVPAVLRSNGVVSIAVNKVIAFRMRQCNSF
eukprot:scaffold171630_cov34-Attheya_sp.AAC.2